MSWAWLALLDGDARPADATASAALTGQDGVPLGTLAAWPAGRKPVRQALRVDARIVDPAGEPAWASIVLVPAGRAPLFDDPSVSGALRAVLAGPPADAVSTLVRDAVHFAGAVTVRRADRQALRDDPFARICRPLLARVGPGLFGRVPAPAGPVIQRYAGQPWPAAGF